MASALAMVSALLSAAGGLAILPVVWFARTSPWCQTFGCDAAATGSVDIGAASDALAAGGVDGLARLLAYQPVSVMLLLMSTLLLTTAWLTRAMAGGPDVRADRSGRRIMLGAVVVILAHLVLLAANWDLLTWFSRVVA